MSKEGHILLVEDEPNFGSVLSQFLSMHDFAVTWAKNGAEAYSLIKSDKPFDCCVLDVMMPEMDGFTLGGELRKSRQGVPFIFLTAKSLKEDVIRGFQTGADDYITKPFDSEILVYKLKALLQRKPELKTEQTVFQIGIFDFDSERRILRNDEAEKRLSPKENALLTMLARQMGQVVSREDILESIWKEDNYFTRRSMDVYVAKLRKILASDEAISITSLRAGGYILSA